jgi:hypothetical protein
MYFRGGSGEWEDVGYLRLHSLGILWVLGHWETRETREIEIFPTLAVSTNKFLCALSVHFLCGLCA